MRKAISLLLLYLSILSAYAEEIDLKVIEKETNEAVPFASLVIEYPDTLVVNSTNIKGYFSFVPISLPLTIKIKSLGLKETSATITSLPDSIVTFVLDIDSKVLNEVAVIGRLTTQTNSGISYNMAGNQRAQKENALQSLSYVPLVNVDHEGIIAVQGSSSFSLYLNGRPYDMAQTSPKVFLESLPASSIAKVEVITRADNKYGADSDRYILNIVLKQPVLNGYVVNLSGGGNTQPTANGSVMGMIKKNKVDVALNYTYNLNGQRNQPMDITYTEKDLKGNDISIRQDKGTGDGNWNTHTLRALLKWEIDSLNSLYADAHGQIKQTNLTDNRLQSTLYPDSSTPESYIENHSEFTTGAAEANLIYRNYFKDSPQTERITAGYHYTYNPDKRNIRQYRMVADAQEPELIQHTDGGLNAHTGLFSYLMRLSYSHYLRVTASNMYRHGETSSTYIYQDYMQEKGNSMHYTNNIAALNISFTGWLGKVYYMLAVKGNYDYFSMKLPDSSALDYKRSRLYILPSASLFWRPDDDNTLYLDYSTNLTRPSIDMLNPFESSLNDLSSSRGNPNLKAQYNHDVAITWYLTKIKNLTLAASLQYEHMGNVLLTNYSVEKDRLIYSYSNFGKAEQTEFAINMDYEPVNWLSLKINGKVGKRWLRGQSQDLKQDNPFYSITPSLDFYLPNHFRIGAKYGYYKNLPNPWSTRSAMNQYSFYISKSLLSGRLNVSVSANSPFSKYIHNNVVTTLPTMATNQNNYITGRSFGINLSYSFGEGQKVKLQRDKLLDTSDQTTGVK